MNIKEHNEINSKHIELINYCKKILLRITEIKNKYPSYPYDKFPEQTIVYAFNDTNLQNIVNHLEELLNNCNKDYDLAQIKIKRVEQFLKTIERQLKEVEHQALLDLMPKPVNRLDEFIDLNYS